MARFAVSATNIHLRGRKIMGTCEAWGTCPGPQLKRSVDLITTGSTSPCAPSRSAAGSPSTSADFNLGPGPKLKFDGENFNFGPGPRLNSKSVKISFDPAIPATILAICCKPVCYR